MVLVTWETYIQLLQFCLGPLTQIVLGCFYPPVGSVVFPQDFSSSHKKQTVFQQRHFTEKKLEFKKFELETVRTINYLWVCLKICRYKYLLRYNGVKSSKIFKQSFQNKDNIIFYSDCAFYKALYILMSYLPQFSDLGSNHFL